MGAFEIIFERAKQNPRRVAFPENTNEKILQAINIAQERGFCIPYLIGDSAQIEEAAKAQNISLEGKIIVNTNEESYVDSVVERYQKNNPFFSTKALKRKARDPLYIALMMEAIGDVDCTFAGFTHTTAEVAFAGQSIIGMKPDVPFVTSVALFSVEGFHGGENGMIVLGDPAYKTHPDSEELATMAILACDTVKSILGWEPRCALLSYSTTGSGTGPHVDKVAQATKIANERRPDLIIDGELQLDTAIDMEIANKKMTRESQVAGKANILIFPNIEAGNIGVKLIQQFANADAIMPIAMGFKMPVQDCSRGSSVEEMVGDIAISCLQVQ